MAVDVKWLCLLVTTLAAVDGRQVVNVALNRPSYQSSNYTDYYAGTISTANKANDGNRDSNFWHGSCMHTLAETNPWWVVDLLVQLYVAGVDFTNRQNVAYRSDNFIVGLSNVSPTVTAPTIGNYTVCGRYPGAVAAGATVYQRCDSCLPAYRYVIVQFEITDYANFCELEVYVRHFCHRCYDSQLYVWARNGWEWQSREGQKMINKVTDTLQVDYRLQCMMKCRLSATCDSYNYRLSDKTCELNTHDTPLIANSADIVADNAWTWWSPTFCTVD